LWPVVTRQFAAGSWVMPGYVRVTPPPTACARFRQQSTVAGRLKRLAIDEEILSTIRSAWMERTIGQPDQIEVRILTVVGARDRLFSFITT